MSENGQAAVRIRLTEAGRSGAEAYGSEYASSFDEIAGIIAQNRTGSHTIRCADALDAADALKVGLLYNETSLLDFSHAGGELRIMVPGPNSSLARMYGKLLISVPPNVAPAVANAVSKGRANVGFAMAMGEDIDKFFLDAANLIQSGRVVVRPRRLVLYDTEVRTAEGGLPGTRLKQHLTPPGTAGPSWMRK